MVFDWIKGNEGCYTHMYIIIMYQQRHEINAARNAKTIQKHQINSSVIMEGKFMVFDWIKANEG